MTTCPCGSDTTYENCCRPYHEGAAVPPTAEKLMRSRYCAFVKKEYDYLEETLDPQTILDFDHEGNREWARKVDLYKLEILTAEESGTKASVEFKAHYRDSVDGKDHIHHELSKFRKQGGIWYFRQGKVFPS